MRREPTNPTMQRVLLETVLASPVEIPAEVESLLRLDPGAYAILDDVHEEDGLPTIRLLSGRSVELHVIDDEQAVRAIAARFATDRMQEGLHGIATNFNRLVPAVQKVGHVFDALAFWVTGAKR